MLRELRVEHYATCQKLKSLELELQQMSQQRDVDATVRLQQQEQGAALATDEEAARVVAARNAGLLEQFARRAMEVEHALSASQASVQNLTDDNHRLRALRAAERELVEACQRAKTAERQQNLEIEAQTQTAQHLKQQLHSLTELHRQQTAEYQRHIETLERAAKDGTARAKAQLTELAQRSAALERALAREAATVARLTGDLQSREVEATRLAAESSEAQRGAERELAHEVQRANAAEVKRGDAQARTAECNKRELDALTDLHRQQTADYQGRIETLERTAREAAARTKVQLARLAKRSAALEQALATETATVASLSSERKSSIAMSNQATSGQMARDKKLQEATQRAESATAACADMSNRLEQARRELATAREQISCLSLALKEVPVSPSSPGAACAEPSAQESTSRQLVVDATPSTRTARAPATDFHLDHEVLRAKRLETQLAQDTLQAFDEAQDPEPLDAVLELDGHMRGLSEFLAATEQHSLSDVVDQLLARGLHLHTAIPRLNMWAEAAAASRGIALKDAAVEVDTTANEVWIDPTFRELLSWLHPSDSATALRF